jgi:hypothetical protein
MNASASAHGLEAPGEERAHAVGGRLVVAGRFDLDELADGLNDFFLAGFEVAEALGPEGVELVRFERVLFLLGIFVNTPWVRWSAETLMRYPPRPRFAGDPLASPGV